MPCLDGDVRMWLNDDKKRLGDVLLFDVLRHGLFLGRLRAELVTVLAYPVLRGFAPLGLPLQS